MKSDKNNVNINRSHLHVCLILITSFYLMNSSVNTYLLKFFY